MSIHYATFVAVSVLGATYFLFAKRTFDVWALSFFSACFYFMPGYFGYAAYANGLFLTKKSLVPGAYGVMLAVLCLQVVGGVLSAARQPGSEPRLQGRERPYGVAFASVSVAFGCIGCALTVVTVGDSLFAGDKVALLSELNRWQLLWTSGASLGLIAAVQQRLWLPGLVALMLQLVNVAIGFRVDFVLAVLACLFIIQRASGRDRLVRRWKVLVAAGILGLAMLMLKYFLLALQLMDFDLVLRQAKNPELFDTVILYSEPFVVQGTLNEVVANRFWVGPGHLANVAYLMLPFANELGAPTEGFNDLFQPSLFSSVTEFGLGSNIWAEMLASGGWPLLVVFMLCTCGACLLIQRLADCRNSAMSAVAALLVGYWSFYVHRNDLIYQLTLTRRFVLAGLFFAAVAWLLVRVGQYLRVGSEPGKGQLSER